MPKIAAPLTDRGLSAALARQTAPGAVTVGEVPGLFVKVSPTGAKSWVLRAVLHGERKEWGLGGYPDTALAAARAAARVMRSQIADGINPTDAKAAMAAVAAKAVAASRTFEWCAAEYIAAKRPGWKSDKHAAQWESSLATYAHPVLGAFSVGEVTTEMVLQVLRPIWTAKPETARRVANRLELVLGWATVHGHRTGDNPARWAAHLQTALPARKASDKHHAAMPYADVPAFAAALSDREGMAAKALAFAILTAARSGEVRGATWGEIDLDAKLWTVPAKRMKGGIAHAVPLSVQAVGVLAALPSREGHSPEDLLFPSPLGGAVLSDMTLGAVLKRMGQPYTAHGFRSSFRDWCAEGAVPRDLAEMALAHKVGGAVEQAYQRSSLLVRRAAVMRDWGAFVAPTTAATTTGGNVVPMRAAA